MPFTPQTLEEKPYNMCINCTHIGKTCDGPNFLAMTIERWCEWCTLRKDYLGWSNARLAEKANVAKISVDRITSGNVKDLRITTMQAVTQALVNGSWGKHPCVLAADGENIIYRDSPELIARCEQLQQQANDIRADDRRKIDHLKREVDFLSSQLDHKDVLISNLMDILKTK